MSSIMCSMPFYISLFYVLLHFICITGLPLVRNISKLSQDNYGRGGLSHITLAGSVSAGLREVPNTLIQNVLIHDLLSKCFIGLFTETQ